MEHIGRKFRNISRISERDFNNKLAEYDLTHSQMDVLILLFRRKDLPVCQRDIEEGLGLKNPTVTGILNRLEAKGFIRRETLAGDRRCNRIVVTENAKELDKALLASIHANDERMLRGFTEEESAFLADCLDRIIMNLSE